MSTTRPGTVRELIHVASTWLQDQGVDEARLDTEVLLAHTLGCKRLDLYLDHDRPLVDSELEGFRTFMRRRASREPVAYITGSRGFHGLDLEVGPGVLIPRPETEHLVEVGLDEIDRLASLRDEVHFVDVGTGSGCVALAICKERTNARAVATDVSGDALRIARRNAAACGVTARVSLVQASLLAPLGPRSLDLVISNPPYVTPGEESLLAPEIRDFEPRAALFDAADLPLTRALIEQSRLALRPGGAIALETGHDKAELVASYLAEAGFAGIRRVRDLGDIERVVAGRLPEDPGSTSC